MILVRLFKKQNPKKKKKKKVKRYIWFAGIDPAREEKRGRGGGGWVGCWNLNLV